MAIALPASAADRWFDGTTTGGLGDGTSQTASATWNTTISNWDQGYGLSRVAWNNANNDTAVFAGAGTVTLGENIEAAGITFLAGSDNIYGSYTLTLAGTSPFINNATTITIGTNANATILGGTNGLSKFGVGTLNLQGTAAHTLTGGITVYMGSLITMFANTALTSGVLDSGNSLSLAGGTFGVQSRSGTACSQTLGNLTVGAGRSTISIMAYGPGGPMALTLGNNWSRHDNGALNLGIGSGASLSSSPSLNNGIIGPWVTVQSNSVCYYTSVSDGKLIALTSAAAFNYSLSYNDPTGNYDSTSGGTTSASGVALNTIRYKGAAAGTTSLAGPFSVNGLLNAGSAAWTIDGGPITVGASKELVINNNASKGFVINAAIQDNTPNNGSKVTIVSPTTTSNGTAMVLLGTDSSYSGATTINGNNTLGDGIQTVAVPALKNKLYNSRLGAGADLYLSGAIVRVDMSAENACDRNLILNGNSGFLLKGTNRLTLAGTISGPGNLCCDEDGLNFSSANLILSGDNSFSGELVFVMDGRVILDSPNALKNATLNVTGQRIGVTLANDHAFNLGGLKGNALDINLGTATANGGSGFVSIGSNNKSCEFLGSLSGRAGLIKKGTGTQTMVKCAYLGDTIIEGGTLRLRGVAAMETGVVSAVTEPAYSNRVSVAVSAADLPNLAVGQPVNAGGTESSIYGIDSTTPKVFLTTPFEGSQTVRFYAMGASIASPAIEVKAGATLDLSPLAAGFTLVPAQTLKGAGTIIGSLTVASGATIQLGSGGASLTFASSGAAPIYNAGAKLKIIATNSALDKINRLASASHDIRNVDLIIDTTGLRGDVPSTPIYTVPSSSITGPFHSVTVIGNTAFTPTLDYSITGQINLALTGNTTTCSLNSSQNPSLPGAGITFTATVTATTGTPTGTVEFRTNNVAFGSASLSGNTATLTSSALPHGSHAVTAVYLGEGSFTGSISSSLLQVVNTPPLARSFTMGAQVGLKQSAHIINGPKYAPTDADSDALTLSAVTQGPGGTAVINGDFLEYTPVTQGTNQFAYTVSDGFAGGTSDASVTVIVSPADATTQKAQIAYDASGVTVTFFGIPGVDYTVQRSTNASGPWQDLVTRPASPLGHILHTDPAPFSPFGFYRLKP
jgi:hypothetical protein